MAGVGWGGGGGCNKDCSKAEVDPSVLHRTFWLFFFFSVKIKTVNKTADWDRNEERVQILAVI